MSPLLLQEVIEAPDAGAGGGEIKEVEAEDDGDFAEIVDREKAAWEMCAEVSDGHFAGENECSGASEKANEDQEAANHFQHASDSK